MSFAAKGKKVFDSWQRSLVMGARNSMSLHSWRNLRKNFKKALTKKNFLYSIKAGIAASISYVWAECMNMDYSLWAPLSTLMVMQMHISASLEVGVFKCIGTIVGAILGLIVSICLPHTIEGRALGLCIVVPLGIFLERWEARFQMAGVTAVLVLILGHTLDSGAIMFALNRVLEMGIGIVCALSVSLLLWPTSAAGEVQATVHKQFLQTAAHIEKMTAIFLDGHKTLSPRDFNDFLKEIGDNSQRFYRVRKYELIHIYREYPLLAHKIRLMLELRTYVMAMADSLSVARNQVVEEHLTEIVTDLAKATAATLQWFTEKNMQNPPEALLPLIQAESSHFATARAEGQFRHYTHDEVVQLFAFYNGLNHVARAVSNLQERLIHEHIT